MDDNSTMRGIMKRSVNSDQAKVKGFLSKLTGHFWESPEASLNQLQSSRLLKLCWPFLVIICWLTACYSLINSNMSLGCACRRVQTVTMNVFERSNYEFKY